MMNQKTALTERFNCICKNYPTKILMANAQRVDPYRIRQSHNSFPEYVKKGIADKTMIWHKDGRLVYADTKQLVARNSKLAGTPREVKVSGQLFWEGGNDLVWYRIKLKEQLAHYFTVRITQQLPEKITPAPGHYLVLEYIFYVFEKSLDVISGKNGMQDINNYSYPYIKSFADTLEELGTIVDDSPRTIRGDYYRYVGIADDDEQRLEIKFHFCKNGEPIRYE